MRAVPDAVRLAPGGFRARILAAAATSRWPTPAGSAARGWLERRGPGEGGWTWLTMVWILSARYRLPRGGIRACGGGGRP
jgi:hypothetical protein